MVTKGESQQVVECCQINLNWANETLPDEYFYQSLPLCIIDAVFSIGVKYDSTRNVVNRFCNHFGINHRRKELDYPHQSSQLSARDFLKIYEKYGVEKMTEEVYDNRQRTSTRNGILKSDATLRFSRVLDNHYVNYFQDIEEVIGKERFENAIMTIPGQGSGISLKYFYMLAGLENYIKPDRMIKRFLSSCIRRDFSMEECQELITSAYNVLAMEFPHLTLRTLDYLIWQYQRQH